jgi:RND family efflux transporter MFP subunit
MPRRRGFRPIHWVLIAAVALAACAGGIGLYFVSRPAVTVTTVIEGPVVEAFYATGTLQPAREYPIRATAAGILMKPPGPQPYVDKGDHVTAGQPLAVVADAQWQAAYDKAKAELEEKRKRAEEATSPILQEFDAKVSATQELLAIARREHQRVLHLLEEGSSSQGELDQAANRVKQTWMDFESYKAQKATARLMLQRELDQAEAAVKAAEWNVDQQTLRSPVDGVVLDRPVPLGTRLGVNDHVMQVADVRPDQLVMRAQVDEEDITTVHAGQIVRMVLYAYPGRRGDNDAGLAPGPATRPATNPTSQPTTRPSEGPSFVGEVVKIYDKADPDRRTFEVDVKPRSPDPKFAAGMTGELAFEVTAKPRAIIVPSQAVQDGKVYVVRQGRVRAVNPRVGIRGIERTELLAGVQVGERVLITPVAGLSEGQFVRERYMDPGDAAALNKPKPKELFKGGF